MSSKWRDEQGWTVVTAMILMTVMLGLGLATVSLVDTQAKESAVTRQRDTAFNLAEAALNAQVHAISLSWPGAGYGANPSTTAPSYRNYTCWYSSATNRSPEPVLQTPMPEPAAATPLCPSADTLNPLLNNVDARGATWRTWVYDDPAPAGTNAVERANARGKYYSDALVAAGDPETTPGAGYDSNKDGKLWVKASATVRGRTRSIVTLVEVQTFQQDLVHTVFLAGALSFSNQGGHSGYFIEQPTATTSNVVTLRCELASTPDNQDCVGYPEDDPRFAEKLGGAINPPNYGNDRLAPNALSPQTLDELRDVARKDGTYYSATGPLTCNQVNVPPTSFNVLYIKDCGLISWSSNLTLNQPTTDKPGGMIILDNTRLRMNGVITINGIVYARNPPKDPGTNPLTWTEDYATVEALGCTQINGGLIIDDGGVASIGSCGQADRPNLVYRPQSFETVQTYTSAGIIKNTWRELLPG